MGWLQITLDGVIIVCEALKKTDVNHYLQSKAEELVKTQARAVVPTILDRVLLRSSETIASENISSEFERIFKHPNFVAFMKSQFNQLNGSILVPLIERIEEYTTVQESRLYALPKFIVADKLYNFIVTNLEASVGLPQIWVAVYGENSETRWEQVKNAFFGFVATTGVKSALDGLDKLASPKIKWGLTGRYIEAKVVRRGAPYYDIYFFGVNSDLPWKAKNPNGHYFFRKFGNDPGLAIAKRIQEESRSALDAQLVGVDIKRLGADLEQELDRGKISSETRNKLSYTDIAA